MQKRLRLNVKLLLRNKNKKRRRNGTKGGRDGLKIKLRGRCIRRTINIRKDRLAVESITCDTRTRFLSLILFYFIKKLYYKDIILILLSIINLPFYSNKITLLCTQVNR